MKLIPSINDILNKVVIGIQSLRQLGLEQVGLFVWYRMLLKSGWLKLRTLNPKKSQSKKDDFKIGTLAFPPQEFFLQKMDSASLQKLYQEAEEICRGRIRLFGGEAADLELIPPQSLKHWTAHEGKKVPVHGGDIKFIWEPARLGWVFILGRAYHIFRKEEFAEAFWKFFEIFLKNNPPYKGLNWTSGQEVGLRILAMVFAREIFANSPHSSLQRLNGLSDAIAVHAQRIPPTLIYARAQYNNHLFSEAVGLFTAGVALNTHPRSQCWQKMGWRWLNYAIQTQIEKDGTFIQHSSNYHRFILQAVLWAVVLAQPSGRTFSTEIRDRLTATTHWLLKMCVPCTGSTPNLGSNDGAYILPLDSCGYADYRPTLQAAGRAFLNQSLFEPGAWDEMSLWLGFVNQLSGAVQKTPALQGAPIILHNHDSKSWAYLRAARFHCRPGHADQLHLDLWWRDLNIAQDAGTFSYNAAPPWDNSLSHTAVHNTLMINAKEQMTRAGRFLYLDWANAEVLEVNSREGVIHKVMVRHSGYLGEGVFHQRSVIQKPSQWKVVDQVIQASSKRLNKVQARLHWLTHDMDWQLQETYDHEDALTFILLQSKYGQIGLRIRVKSPAVKTDLTITRSGDCLYGKGTSHPTWGWTSPTYGTKIPALSLALSFEGIPPLEVISEWVLPEIEEP